MKAFEYDESIEKMIHMANRLSNIELTTLEKIYIACEIAKIHDQCIDFLNFANEQPNSASIQMFENDIFDYEYVQKYEIKED